MEEIMKRQILILFAGIAALVSCSKEATSVIDSNEMRFKMAISGTKASSSAFEVGDKVAIWAVEQNGDSEMPLQISGNLLNNEGLTLGESGWTGRMPFYWGDAPCNFYAVYPYLVATSIERQVFSVCTDQTLESTENGLSAYEASDLLYASAKNVSRSADGVALSFDHMMSKCVVNILKGETFDGDLSDDIVVHIYNTATDAVLNIAEGSIEKKSDGAFRTITMRKLADNRFDAIVVPQNIDTRTPLIEVTMQGIAYLLDYSLSFKPGYTHTINITLNTSPDQEQIEISIDAGQGGWN